MTFTATGSFLFQDSGNLATDNQGDGNLLIVEVLNYSDNEVYCNALTGGGATWDLVYHQAGSTNTMYSSVFFGTVTATGTGTATPSWSGSEPGGWEINGHEFISSVGSWELDTQGFIDSAGTVDWASLVPASDDELYWGSATNGNSGSTSGYVYSVNGNSDTNAYRLSCPAGTATFPVTADASGFGTMVLVKETSSGGSITPLQSKSANALSLTFDDNLSANTKLIAVVTVYTTSTTAVDDGNGNSFTKLAYMGLNNDISGAGELSLWAMDTPAGDVGTKPTITATSDTSYPTIVIQEVPGLLAGNTSAMLDGTPATSSSVGATSLACGSYSTTSPGEYLLAMYGDDQNNDGIIPSACTGSTTYTLDPNNIDNGECTALAYGDSTGGVETATFTLSANSNEQATLFVAFKLASSGVSTSGAIKLKKMSVAAAVNAPSGLFNLFSNINMSGLACAPDANGYTLGTEFEVTTDGCSLKGVRFFSASGAIELPQQIGLYNVSGETLIQSQDASWDGDPATGWVTALFDTPIVLDPTAKYVLTAMQTEAVIWYTSGNHFWDTGLGSSGITNGPLSAPNLSASAGGQGLYDYASIPDMGFPASTYQGSTYWVDPVVDGPGTPSSPSESSVLSIFGGNLPDISVSAANDSPYNIGIQFIVTEDGCELAGYSWYVPDDGDVNGSDYDFALYTTTDGASGTIVDGSTVTGSGTWLTGTWNYTELETPVPLSTGVTYVAVGEIISVSGNTYQAVPDFWDTGAGASGIIAGPLTAPEASTAVGGYQQPYAVSHVFPTLSYENSWYGIDVGVTQSSGVSVTGALSLKKMVLSGVGVAPDIYVIQTMRSDGGTYSATFDDPISEHSTILICATGYTGSSETPESSDPQLDGVSVPDAVQLIPDFWNAACGGTVWMLPDVEVGSPVISLTVENFGSNSENGIFLYEIANLGPNPQLDQFIVSNPHTGDSASFSISPITNRPEFVLGMYIQDGGNPPSGPGDGWNNSGLQGNWGGANNGSGFYQIADTAGAEYSMAWTNDGVVNWSGVILSLMQGGPSASISGVISLKKMVLSGASHEKAVITGSIKLKKMVLSGASAEKAVVTGSVKLKKMVLSGASAEKAIVTGAIKLKKMVLSGASAEKAVVTGTVKLKKMVLSGASAEKAVVTGSVKLKKMGLSGASAEKAVVTGAIKLKKMVLAGSSTKTVSASGAISLKKMVISGASHEKAVITGSVSLKKMVLAGAGTEKPAITGTIKLKKMVISGASHEKAVITGTITLKKMRVHGEEAKRKASTLFVFWPL